MSDEPKPHVLHANLEEGHLYGWRVECPYGGLDDMTRPCRTTDYYTPCGVDEWLGEVGGELLHGITEDPVFPLLVDVLNFGEDGPELHPRPSERDGLVAQVSQLEARLEAANACFVMFGRRFSPNRDRTKWMAHDDPHNDVPMSDAERVALGGAE